MKTVLYLTPFTLNLASASLKSLHANVEKLVNSQTASGGRANLRSGDRAFQGFIKEMFADINGYGCWCYLDGGWRDDAQAQINRPAIQAHGMAVDPIDESCRDLINSYVLRV